MLIFIQNIIFFIKLTKVLEVANFRFMANFRFLTLQQDSVQILLFLKLLWNTIEWNMLTTEINNENFVHLTSFSLCNMFLAERHYQS